MTTRPAHCTAEHPCWELHQRWSPDRVREHDIFMAHQVLLAMICTWQDPNLNQSVEIAAQARVVSELRGRQWRQMVRGPFDFPILTVKIGDLNEKDLATGLRSPGQIVRVKHTINTLMELLK